MERLFNLDPQLIHDTILLMIAMFVIFTFLSYLLFNPARAMLKKRQDKIQSEIEDAAKKQSEAGRLKDEYESRIKKIQGEAEEILSQARQKALRNEAVILEEAKEEARRIVERSNMQISLDMKKAEDGMKREMIGIASLMAAAAVKTAVDKKILDALMEETLKEIGEEMWQS